MTKKLDPRLNLAATTQSTFTTALTLAHSLRARGVKRTLLFAGLGFGLPITFEYIGINLLKVVRHHTQPQFKGVPLFAALGWYNIGYATYAMLESVIVSPDQKNIKLLPLGTALVATSFDLLADCYGLDQGLWEWNAAGLYAAEISGPNGIQGIPIGNFGGWLVLTGGVSWLYQRFSDGSELNPAKPNAAGSLQAGRNAALLLLPSYLMSAGWALASGKFKYLLYSILFPLILFLALLGRKRTS